MGNPSTDDGDASTYASRQRQEVVAALRAVPAEAPTLCAGWTARDLAAHLVTRERRPDALPGLVVPGLSIWTEHVRRRQAGRDYRNLVDQLADGPPRFSPFALPRIGEGANLMEFFIHGEDVRRAQPGWDSRELESGFERALWKTIAGRGRLLFRHSPVGVVLTVPGGPSRQVRDGEDPVVLHGRPGELLLYAAGRQGQARVEVTGSSSAVEAFETTRLGL